MLSNSLSNHLLKLKEIMCSLCDMCGIHGHTNNRKITEFYSVCLLIVVRYEVTFNRVACMRAITQLHTRITGLLKIRVFFSVYLH